MFEPATQISTERHHCFRKDGQPKRAYLTKYAALQVLVEIVRRTRDAHLHYYLCPCCKRWHIGHQLKPTTLRRLEGIARHCNDQKAESGARTQVRRYGIRS